MDLKTAFAWLKATIENNFTAAVKSVKAHIFTVKLQSNKVEVTNLFKLPPELNVKVSNPSKDYQSDINSIKEMLSESFKKLNGVVLSIKPSGSVKINNLKDIPAYPEKIEVTNPQKEVKVTNLNDIAKGFADIVTAIKKLPQKFPEAKDVVIDNRDILESLDAVTKAIGKLDKKTKEIDLKEIDLTGSDAKKYIPVRLTDGEKFYEAVSEIVAAGSRLSYAYSDLQGKKQQALVDSDRHVQVDVVTMPPTEVTIPSIDIANSELNDMDDSVAPITYFGFEDQNGVWMIKKMDETSGINNTFATENNNGTINSYSEAWSNKSSLTYEKFSIAKEV